MVAVLHATLTPNVVEAGGKLTLQFDGTTDVTDLLIQIFEVDPVSPFEPKSSPGSLLVEFHGEVKSDKFSLTPRKDGKNNPLVSQGSGAGSPQVTIEVVGASGNASATVTLPDANEEQGIFEVAFRLIPPKGPKPKSPPPVMVRSFTHFKVKGVPRPVVAFITGATSDPFFKHAEDFWRRNADAVVSQERLSLDEMNQYLQAEGQKYGAWGQVNILAHGREKQISVRAFAKSPEDAPLHVDRINEELKSNTPVIPTTVDAETEVVFRACNAGNEQELVDAIRKTFFPKAKFVKIPKFPIAYESTVAGGRVTAAREFFEERLSFDRPTRAEAEKDEDAGLNAAFDRLAGVGSPPSKSPGLAPSANRAQERATFTQNHDESFGGVDASLVLLENAYRNPDGTDVDKVQLLRDKWVPQGYDKKTASWKTNHDRWHLVVDTEEDLSKTLTATQRGVLFEVTSGTSDPKIQLLGSGTVAFGAADTQGIWQIENATDLADLHAQVQLNDPSLAKVRVEDMKSGTPTKVTLANGSAKILKDGAWVEASLPSSGKAVTITMGSATVVVRLGKVLKVNYKGTRYFIDRRREMRDYEAGSPHAQRKTVTKVKLDDDRLFGTSS